MVYLCLSHLQTRSQKNSEIYSYDTHTFTVLFVARKACGAFLKTPALSSATAANLILPQPLNALQ